MCLHGETFGLEYHKQIFPNRMFQGGDGNAKTSIVSIWRVYTTTLLRKNVDLFSLLSLCQVFNLSSVIYVSLWENQSFIVASELCLLARMAIFIWRN